MCKDCESIIKEIKKLTNKIETIDKKVTLIMQMFMPPPNTCSTYNWINSVSQSMVQLLNSDNGGFTHDEKFLC